MPEPTPPPEPADEQLVDEQGASDPPEPDDAGDPPVYTVARGADECAVAEDLELPRRPNAGRRGVLLVDRRASLVYLLDADDERQVFVGRARRQLAGDPAAIDPAPAGVDDVLRAAYEYEYDVIAAPWVDDDDQGEPPATADEPAAKPRKRAARGGAR